MDESTDSIKKDPYDGLADLAPDAPKEDHHDEAWSVPDLTEVAKEVIRGEWGTGVERRKKLADAGFNPNEVQKEIVRIVNE